LTEDFKHETSLKSLKLVDRLVAAGHHY